MTAGAAKHRAIGIVRVSQRDDESGHSPEVQVRAMLEQTAGEDFTCRCPTTSSRRSEAR